MANELITSWDTAKTVFFHIFDSVGRIWNTSTLAFQAYSTAQIANYAISSTEQGTASGYYRGSFPSAILTGVFTIYAKLQSGGSPAESDITIGTQYNYQWNGTAEQPLVNAPVNTNQWAGTTVSVDGNNLPVVDLASTGIDAVLVEAYTMKQALRLIAAVLCGTASGGPNATVFNSMGGATPRVTSVDTGNGDRTTVTLSP